MNRQFQNREYRDAVISGLTHVRVGSRYDYICVLVELYNQEIIGYSAGGTTAGLVKEVFQSVEGSLEDISLFHID